MKSKLGSRLVSLDAFRGLAIVLMVLVNVGGLSFSQLQHSSWNGLTIADAVFPFFLWIMGVSMVFSFSKRIKEAQSKRELFLHILKRSAILFAIGFFLNLLSNFDFSTVRIFGVLQRIAMTYFLAGIVMLYFKPKKQAIIAVALLIAYWLLLKLVPVPGYGAGVLEVGKNLPQYVDTALLKGHMWQPYGDPEGLLSTIPALATVLFGVLIGNYLVADNEKRKAPPIFLFGVGLSAAGYAMGFWLPINKQLWTSSFAVLTAGLACVILSIGYWLFDLNSNKLWSSPFVVFGRNAISVYVLGILISSLLYIIKPSWNASPLFVLSYVLLLFAVAYVMYRNKFFLKI